MKKMILTVIATLIAITSHAETLACDSVDTPKSYKVLLTGSPLLVTGLLMRGEDTHFRNLRNDYMTERGHKLENYSQYLPVAVLYGLKAAGVESRSSWGRMVASDALSAAIMATTVESIKRTTKEERPDGTDNRSFPSGHTAMAFMTATMLTKEYGHISPWIGIGAYTIATGTGMMRVANNRHWVSDVFTGAGIGIISTELGYYVADMIFKNRGLGNHGLGKLGIDDTFSRMDNPSFVGIGLGINLPLGNYKVDDSHESRISNGCTVGVEGAYFFNTHLGVGGSLAVQNTHIITNHTLAEDNQQESYMLMAGPYVSYPVTSRLLIGSKLLAGCVGYRRFNMTDGLSIPEGVSVCLGTGVSFTYRLREQYGMRLFVDYNVMQPHSLKTNEWGSALAFGTAFCVNF